MTDKFKIIESIQPWPTVTIYGEIDHSNVRQARVAVNRLLKEGSSILIFDFTSVSYLDTSGAALVFGTAKKLVDRDGQLRVVIPPSYVRKTLERYGIENITGTTLFDNLKSALDG